MADYPVTEISKVGLVLDRATALLPPEAWTHGENVKFSTEGVSRQWGDLLYIDTPLAEAPRYLIMSPRLVEDWFGLAICSNSVQAITATYNTDVSPLGGWAITDVGLVTGCLLNNLPVFNHPDYSPMFWDAVLVNQATPLPGLDPTIRFNVIRSFNNFLLGIGVKDIGSPSLDMNRIMWSGVADPGTVPPTWNPIGSLAGSTILASAQGDLIDCLPLGDINYIYSSNSVYSMQFIGGQQVFKFALRFEDFGLLAPNCLASFKNYHFVVTNNDFIIHNGVSWESVGTGLIRRYFKETLDTKNYLNSFVVVHESQKEIWFFYPTTLNDSIYPTQILIWNWELRVWGIRSCSPATCGAFGYRKEVTTWATPGLGNWPDLDKAWSGYASATVDSVVIYGNEDGNVQSCPPVMFRNGERFKTVIERRTLGFEKVDRFRNPIADPRSHKLILEVWPILRYINDTVQIYVGGQDDYDSDPYWQGPFDFNPANESFIVPAISGKYIAFRLEYDGFQDFLLEGYHFKFEEVGTYI